MFLANRVGGDGGCEGRSIEARLPTVFVGMPHVPMVVGLGGVATPRILLPTALIPRICLPKTWVPNLPRGITIGLLMNNRLIRPRRLRGAPVRKEDAVLTPLGLQSPIITQLVTLCRRLPATMSGICMQMRHGQCAFELCGT